jgi:hypothetical protein
VTGVGDLVQRTGDDHTGQILGGRVIERSGDAVYGLHCAHRDEERGFLGSASKPRSAVYEWFDIKITWTVFSSFTSKPMARVFRFGPQNRQLQFGDLGLKITATISLFVPQKQACFNLSVAPQN